MMAQKIDGVESWSHKTNAAGKFRSFVGRESPRLRSFWSYESSIPLLLQVMTEKSSSWSHLFLNRFNLYVFPIPQFRNLGCVIKRVCSELLTDWRDCVWASWRHLREKYFIQGHISSGITTHRFVVIVARSQLQLMYPGARAVAMTGHLSLVSGKLCQFTAM